MKNSIFTHQNQAGRVLKVIGLVAFLLTYQHASAQIRIEAEDFNTMSGIQTEITTDEGGGLNVGYFDNSDWLEYIIEVPVTGDYRLSFRSASLNGGGVLNVQINGSNLSNITIPSTGGWQNWTTVNSPETSLNQGSVTVRLTASPGGFNLNWIELRLTYPADTVAPSAPVISSSSADVHSINMSWSASTDVGSVVTGYKIYTGTELMAFISGTSYALDKLAPETTFDLQLVAIDLAGNESEAATLSVQTTAIPWDLTWSDEFDGTEVDRDKWNFQVGGGGWGNGEAQYYTDGPNSRVENGYLIIEARQETIGSNDYTSSRMNTANKGDFLYGRIEVRAKLPSTAGTWPAIWTLPTDWIYGSWPDVGEIDIMEHSAYYGLNYVFGTIHTGAYNHIDGTQIGAGKTFEDVVNTFHTYILEWYPDRLDWYYDDEHVFTYENEYKTIDEWPFDIPHHLLLNVAIGGGLGGEINHNGVWPQQMTVDYVRMYDFKLGEGDVTPPSAPGNLMAQVAGTSVELSWDVATDDQFVEKYYIYQDDVLIDSISGTNYTLQCLNPQTTVNIGVQAKDFGDNYSTMATVSATTSGASGVSVPARIEAENYTCVYGIETENCTDIGGGLNLAFINAGDWAEYYIDVPETGTYNLVVRAAAQTSTGRIDLSAENGEVLVVVRTPATGGWQNWESTTSDAFELTAGLQKIRLTMNANSFNVNWIEFIPELVSSLPRDVQPNMKIFPNPWDGDVLIAEISNMKSGMVDVHIYAMDGKLNYWESHELVNGQISMNDIALDPGIYLVNLKHQDGTVQSHRLVVK